ncbi:DNA replication/repair protein RecF [Lawsonibacter faecis]|uniref:DNA replication and repair protein RecF n=1 Tax=Lawsonibacter faecis TaxID=2763052 RepID=A0A8J6JBW2_9FIRM|nr:MULTISPECIES: DNA replication/repair protein RecF [Oscillospiraceae]MTQ97678.1 DNA replication/repair protein RecF [Pseudoflavonifractor sp. BIOML-A16]MTR07382.1 DNA replication/repair protein RecF [Pseudoflavonifractor sp. BIOML-A15]MTR33051.1 DNA replication/repair protein RecF [Pseudoflavonifractor sp. BIOML-A14]MTR74378.1 DNA replication/repair protein RecF [Pseudoflavonifractor sp. BIOML-A18]MTS65501.1 DNA replication/repair protein RecF [Pseudoflavonifractor sp. BIOML-A5]MTS72759.1 D
MIVKGIELDFFRNYLHMDAKFSPELNVICGENAQGKTNLLEAVAYLSTASSHRARYDKELIQFGVDSAFIKGELLSRDRDFTLEARLSRNARKQLFSNGVRLKTAGELAGVLNTVLFCPEDLYLIREGAVERRRFLDSCICQLRPRYAAALAEYRKLYDQKTRILRDWEEKPSLLETLDDFNLRMAQTGAVLIHYRAHFIRKLREYAPPIHREFSGGREILALRYETVKTVVDPEASPKEIFPQLLDHQESHRQAELDARQCLSGPHKDDLTVELDGMSAKQFASQGQTRTAALSLKLGSREIFFHDTGEWPVLLLDDVLSELDARRQAFVLGHINGGQVFITCCEDEKLEGLGREKVFRIHAGRLV